MSAATLPGAMSGTMPGRSLARGSAIALLVLAGVVVTCAAIGLSVVERSDSRIVSGQHAALQTALGELRAVFGDTGHFAPGELALIERRAGLADLRFDADLAAASGRETQSTIDAQGRIVGWFSWLPDRSLGYAMEELWGTALAAGLILALCAILALRATRRLAATLERSTATVGRLTTQDPVTGLANRRVMLKRLDDAVSGRGFGLVAFAMIDIDNSHEIEDTLGRAGRDAMFATIAERFAAALPAGALLGRLTDDDFAVIATDADGRLAATLGDTLATALAAPIYLDQQWLISLTIGLAQAPEDGTTGDELRRRAALALRAAKRSGRGAVRRFVPEIHQEHAERRFILRELETAIHDKAFEVHYQPVVAAEGGGMRGVEALLRWTHPTRGPIAPSVFIPLAEESGLMNSLGELVLRQALADGARWPDLFASVNLSPVQMRSPGLVALVAAVMAETGMPASRLVFEVTEGILIDNPEETLAKLQALRALGASTALDDFGNGYSSLSYLQKFPFDRLKIDRAFVASLGTTANAGAIIHAIVTLGHALGMKVLAEGVETDEQRVLLRLAGCDEMQGFLFAKAVPAEAIAKILARPAKARRSGSAAS
ncbi:MAG: bifunctional diguanylate cyclase/phosphodiesterase [Xanthobacteraceae bacterium]